MASLRTYMRKSLFAVLSVVAISFATTVIAQPNSVTSTNVSASVERTNTAIVPVQRGDQGGKRRADVVLARAKENPGEYDIAFIGDSITQGWEGPGRSIWEKYYGSRKCINLGVSGDRTQHVLWRFEQGQLDGLKPKVAVLMIGTNNSNRDDNSEADILEGVQVIVKQMRERLPDTKVVVLGIFPRGRSFTVQRGKILQVNQALARLADEKNIFYIDFGSQLIENDGSISREIMPDFLHLTEKGYEIWANAIEPRLVELLK